MRVLDWFKQKFSKGEEVQRTVRSRTFDSSRPPNREEKEFLKSFGFRPAMWVVRGNQTGIILGTDMEQIEVMLLDAGGNNDKRVAEAPTELRRAKYFEIPKIRRESISQEDFIKAGYIV